MFRLTHFLQELINPTPVRPRRQLPGPVVIWNLVRRCNLRCKHCYSISGDVDFPGELSLEQVFAVMDDLKRFGVPVLILSGGEPLLRPDIVEISKRSKAMGFYTALSTNGTLITPEWVPVLADIGYDYIGISFDGIGETHDKFRGKQGAFDESLEALRACRGAGIKVGVRFTLTADNWQQLPVLVDLVKQERVDKFYLSHLVYAGRGNKNRTDDATWIMTRRIMKDMIETAWQAVENGESREFVTGNNDADGAFLYLWAKERFPDKAEHLRAKLVEWGGNASGVNVANIDNLGEVHPDTMWWQYSLGNVKKRPFSEIWQDTSDHVMAGLKRYPRNIGGRCASCTFFDTCGGNTRMRALQLTGDPWAEDPACYLTDEEIGVAPSERLTVTPFRRAFNVQTPV